MMPAGNGGTDTSVLERQQAPIRLWQQEQPNFFNENELNNMFLSPPAAQITQFLQPSIDNDSGLCELDPGTENKWPDYGKFGGYEPPCGFGNVSGIDTSYAISPAAQPVEEAAVLPEKLRSAVGGGQRFKKRKADQIIHNLKVIEDEFTKEKKIKAGSMEEEDSNITTEQIKNKNTKNNNNFDNRETSNDTSKVSNVQNEKLDYIHVRARRGQATDSHSLAERVRREKISERMKYLQELVPGCHKVTGKAGMLDEIINYVQSLQRQVEFLSMKLAAVKPRLDFNIDNFFAKEIFPACASSFPAIGLSPEMANPAYLQFNTSQVPCCGPEDGINHTDMELGRTISTPQQLQPHASWNSDLQNLYGVEFQAFTGTSEGGQYEDGDVLKMGM